MSKWLLPTQEGDQLWPKVTKQPMAVRVHGVRGDEEARFVSQLFAPQINHFHQAQAGNRARSGLEVYKARSRPVPGLELAYSYINGLEYLDIRVAAGLITAIPTPTAEDFWDFALVELVLPDGFFDDGAAELLCYAHMTGPDEGKLTDASTWPTNGVASNIVTRDTRDPVINAANSAAVIVDKSTTGGEMTAASFTVDLRRSRGGASTLDVYPYLFVRDESIPGPNLLHALTVFLIYSEIGNPTVPDVEPPFPNPFSGNSSFFSGNTPAIHWDTQSASWLFDANQGAEYTQDDGYSWDGDFPPFTGPNTTGSTTHFSGQPTSAGMIVGTRQRVHAWSWWKLYPVPGYTPPFDGPAHVPAKLDITLFKGVPTLDSIAFAHADRWGFAPGDVVVAPMISINTTVPAYSGSTFPTPPGGLTGLLKNFYDIPKLGTVTLDTHRLIRGYSRIIMNGSFNAAVA